jgi:hypothetical protein
MSTATADTDIALYSLTYTDRNAVVPRRMREDSSWTNSSLPDEPSENATNLHDRPTELTESFRALFTAGKDQIFEDGIESEFSKDLVRLIKKYGNDTLAELAYFIVYEKASAEVMAEALRWLGLMDHLPSYYWRRWLLERSIRSHSARIRDGAALGLAFLNDCDAIPYLKQAIERELIEELREDMQQVLTQLESV